MGPEVVSWIRLVEERTRPHPLSKYGAARLGDWGASQPQEEEAALSWVLVSDHFSTSPYLWFVHSLYVSIASVEGLLRGNMLRERST